MELNLSAQNLRYVNYEIRKEPLPMKYGLPQARYGGESLVLTMEQPNARLQLVYTLFDQAITRRVVLKNIGKDPLRIGKLMSFCLDLPGEYHMTTFDGGWIAEMRKHTVPVSASRVVNESTTGFSSHRHNPGFLLAEPEATEDDSRVYGFNLIYSGNHYASAQQSLQGFTRVMQGILRIILKLFWLPAKNLKPRKRYCAGRIRVLTDCLSGCMILSITTLSPDNGSSGPDRYCTTVGKGVCLTSTNPGYWTWPNGRSTWAVNCLCWTTVGLENETMTPPVWVIIR
jgi:hypothetical protein